MDWWLNYISSVDDDIHICKCNWNIFCFFVKQVNWCSVFLRWFSITQSEGFLHIIVQQKTITFNFDCINIQISWNILRQRPWHQCERSNHCWKHVCSHVQNADEVSWIAEVDLHREVEHLHWVWSWNPPSLTALQTVSLCATSPHVGGHSHEQNVRDGLGQCYSLG